MTAPHDRYAWPQDELSRAEMGALFGFLPDSVQDDFWSHVRGYADAQHALDQDTFFEDSDTDLDAPALPKLSHQPYAVSDDDVLRDLTTDDYFEVLTGQVIPHTRLVHCPSRGHEDRHPSCRVYTDGIHCFACGFHGGVYDLAAEMSGIEPRGRDFFELQRWIAARLLGAAT